jgi:hypothetical protein
MFQILLALLVLRKLKQEKMNLRRRHRRSAGTRRKRHSPSSLGSPHNSMRTVMAGGGGGGGGAHNAFPMISNEDEVKSGDVELGNVNGNYSGRGLEEHDEVEADDEENDAGRLGLGLDEGAFLSEKEDDISLMGSDASSAGSVDGTTETELRKVLEVTKQRKERYY